MMLDFENMLELGYDARENLKKPKLEETIGNTRVNSLQRLHLSYGNLPDKRE